MNDKDQSIRDLVEALPMAENAWTIVDHWEADLCAIGIARAGYPRRLVYISTFGRSPNRYDYQCETPSGPSEDAFVTISDAEDVDYETLLRAMKRHLAGANAIG